MKKTTAFGAVLCSAALAMGMAMPAFALTTGVGTGTSESDSEVSTTVELFGMTDAQIAQQIKAQVPVTLTVSVPENGGNLTCPSSGAYKITNVGEATLKVSGAKVTLASGWALPTGADATAGATISTSNSSAKQIRLDIAAATALGTPTRQALTTTSQALNDTAFASIAKDASVGIDLGGSAKPQGTTTFSTTATEQAAAIVYTIAKVEA